MAAIEKRQKEISDGLALTERAKKDLDLAQANATDQLKKAKAEAQVIIEQANKRRSQILDEAKKLKQNRNAPKSLHKRRLKLMLSVNVYARSCVSRSLSWLLLAPRRSSNVPWMKLLTATSWINLSLNCKEGGADV